jgi:hypothetical protein
VRRYIDWQLETAMSLNQGMKLVDKFGHAPSGIQTTATDVWSRADATPTQQIWLAPTAARVHAIVSTSAEDGAGTLTGALTVEVFGLTSWDTAETSETVTLDGTTPVNTVSSYVILHRMIVRSSGSAGPNVGVISATAATDSTVTAVILAADGQTEMAIMGVPSAQTFLMYGWYMSAIANISGTVRVDAKILCNEFPEDQPTVFLTKHHESLFGAGTSSHDHKFDVPKVFPGPCIVKIQALSTVADTGLSAGFDGVLVTP